MTLVVCLLSVFSGPPLADPACCSVAKTKLFGAADPKVGEGV